MAFNALVIKVMIAAQKGTVKEVQAVYDAIAQWNYNHAQIKEICLMPVNWNLMYSQLCINGVQERMDEEMTNDCDLCIAIYKPSGDNAGGTEHETDVACDRGINVMIYLLKYESSTDNQHNIKMVDLLIDRYKNKAIIKECEDDSEFGRLIYPHLDGAIAKDEYLNEIIKLHKELTLQYPDSQRQLLTSFAEKQKMVSHLYRVVASNPPGTSKLLKDENGMSIGVSVEVKLENLTIGLIENAVADKYDENMKPVK